VVFTTLRELMVKMTNRGRLYMESEMVEVVKARYEGGVLKPLKQLNLREGEVVFIKILRIDLAERVFGSIRVDKETLEKVLKEVEDEFGVY